MWFLVLWYRFHPWFRFCSISFDRSVGFAVLVLTVVSVLQYWFCSIGFDQSLGFAVLLLTVVLILQYWFCMPSRFWFWSWSLLEYQGIQWRKIMMKKYIPWKFSYCLIQVGSVMVSHDLYLVNSAHRQQTWSFCMWQFILGNVHAVGHSHYEEEFPNMSLRFEREMYQFVELDELVIVLCLVSPNRTSSILDVRQSIET